MKLTEQEQQFLAEQGRSADDILDARGLSVKARKQKAKEQGKTLIIGDNPCGKAGHRLRTRSGHCVQCDTSKIAYQSRYSETGYVYIAGSLEKNFLKVGGTGTIYNRESSLRTQGYAGAYDWHILYWVKVANYGRIEGNLHSCLSKYAISESYIKDYKIQNAREVYRCPFTVAVSSLKALIKGSEIISIYLSSGTNGYEFT
jgi:hypothetical protein